MTETLYGLTEAQHAEVGRLVRSNRVTARPETSTATKNRDRYRGIARVILIDSNSPTYQPQVVRECGLFRFSPNGQQRTIEFSGHALEGDLILSINGSEMQIDCAATTADLRAKLSEIGVNARDCRATVFPGLWEFDFNSGRFREKPPTLTCTAYEPPPEDTETPVFSGDLRVVSETWVSVSSNGEVFDTVATREWIPFKPGALTSGAIGAALWSYEAGWMVLAWQCRDYSFRAEG